MCIFTFNVNLFHNQLIRSSHTRIYLYFAQFEQKITAVECYMNQNGGSKTEVFDELEKRVKKAWKDINRECLEPRAVCMPILMRVLNLARVINLLYTGEDCYGKSSDKTRDIVKCVLIDPVLPI